MGGVLQLEATVVSAEAKGQPPKVTGEEQTGRIEGQQRKAVFASDFDSRNLSLIHI